VLFAGSVMLFEVFPNHKGVAVSFQEFIDGVKIYRKSDPLSLKALKRYCRFDHGGLIGCLFFS
jgi:hypothetical protein